MPDPDIKALLRQTPFSVVGTVEHLGAAASGDVPINDHTCVMHVDLVLHAPQMFRGLEGQRITVQLSSDAMLPSVGEQVALFAEGLAFGETIAVNEVARVPVDEVVPHIDLSTEAGDLTRLPGTAPMASLESELADEAMLDHVEDADAVVVGVVMRLQQATPTVYSEHDPMWWRATIEVRQVVRGDLEPGTIEVLFANSLDTAWRRVPKPKASQDGIWILHAAQADLATLAPWQLVHEDDRLPVDALPRLIRDED